MVSLQPSHLSPSPSTPPPPLSDPVFLSVLSPDYHASSADDDDEAPSGRVIRKPSTHIDHVGWLWKKARKLQPNAPPFKQRWFVLSKNTLLYFNTPQTTTAIAEIALADATLRCLSPQTDSQPPPYSPQPISQRQLTATGHHVPSSFFANTFEVDTKQRTYTLRANTAGEYAQWMALLLRACRPSLEENEGLVAVDEGLKRMEAEWAEREEERVERLSELRNTLRDPVACDFFIGWEVDRGREEAVLCWLDCEGWRGEGGEEGRTEKGKEIWESYVKRGGKKEVRIDEGMREEVRLAVEGGGGGGGGEWVEKLQQAMYVLLSTSSFPSFLLSSAFYHAAYAAPPPPSPSPPSPSRHHAYAQARVGTLRQERGGGVGGPSLTPGHRGRRGERGMSAQLEEEDMVIVLSDDSEGGRGGEGGEGGMGEEGGGGGEGQGGGRGGGPAVAMQRGESEGSMDSEDGEYVSVRKQSFSEVVGPSQQGRASVGRAEESAVRSPTGMAAASPMHAQTPMGAQMGGRGPPTPHQQQQGGGGGQQTPQQKGGFFKRMFSSTGVAGDARPAPQSPHQPAAPQSPPAPATPMNAQQLQQQKSTQDALADFYSKKPIAGNAILQGGAVTPTGAGGGARPQAPQPAMTAQQKQAQLAQQMRAQQAQQQQMQAQQQEQQRLQMMQQQAAQQQARASPMHRPQQPPPMSVPTPKAAAPIIEIDFLSGLTSPTASNSSPAHNPTTLFTTPPNPTTSPSPPPSRPLDDDDMFASLTIQPTSTPSSPIATSPYPSAASRFPAPSLPSPYPPPTTTSPPPSFPIPSPAFATPSPAFPTPAPSYPTPNPTPTPAPGPSTITRLNKPPPKPLDDDFDIFGPPTTPLVPPPTRPQAPPSSSSPHHQPAPAPAAAAADPFAGFYGGGQEAGAGGGGGGGGGGGSLDWAFEAPIPKSQGGGGGRGGMVVGGMGMGMGRGGMGGPGMGTPGAGRGGMMQGGGGGAVGGGVGRGQGVGGAAGVGAAGKKRDDEDIFASAFREAQKR